MSRRRRDGLDLGALLDEHDRRAARGGAELELAPANAAPASADHGLALDRARHTADAVAAAERALRELSRRPALDDAAVQLAIAAELVAGNLPAALRRLRALPAARHAELEPLLAKVWGVGRAPRPPGARGADNAESTRGGGLHDLAWLRRLEAQGRQAWRLVDGASGAAAGTAAVIRGEWISPALAGLPLVVTCSHVCTERPPRPGAPPPVPPSRAVLEWRDDDAGAAPRSAKIARLRWESPVDELDASLLEVDGLPDDAQPPAAPPAGAVLAGDRIYLWSYPGGGSLALSFEDNDIEEVRDPHLYYDLATAGGSSGGPVFASDRHALVAIHRGEAIADGRRHGTSFEILLRAMRAELTKPA